jgi:hypothetical protein
MISAKPKSQLAVLLQPYSHTLKAGIWQPLTISGIQNPAGFVSELATLLILLPTWIIRQLEQQSDVFLFFMLP